MSKKERDSFLRLKRFLITIKMLKDLFWLHQKLIKENQNQRLKKVLQREQNKEEKGLLKLKEKKKT